VYLRQIEELTRKIKNPTAGADYPAAINTAALRALYDNVGKDEALALALDQAIQESRQDDWRGNPFKIKKVALAIKRTLEEFDSRGKPAKGRDQVSEDPTAAYPQAPLAASADAILKLAENQNEY
jgi:type I restriction enzyme R subunit